MAIARTDGPDGSTDQALRLDGTVGVQIDTVPLDQSSTFVFWFRADKASSYASLLFGGPDHTEEEGAMELAYDALANSLQLTYWTVADPTTPVVSSVTPSPALSTGWHLVAIVVDTEADSVAVYVDGSLEITVSQAVPVPTRTSVLVGYAGAGAREMDLFDFSQWTKKVDIEDLVSYQAEVIADPDKVLPPED